MSKESTKRPAQSAAPAEGFEKFYKETWDGASTDLFGAAEAYAALRTAAWEDLAHDLGWPADPEFFRTNIAAHRDQIAAYMECEKQLATAESSLAQLGQDIKSLLDRLMASSVSGAMLQLDDHFAGDARMNQTVRSLARQVNESGAALAQARERIVGNVDLKQLSGWLDFELSGSPGDGMLADCKAIVERLATPPPPEGDGNGNA